MDAETWKQQDDLYNSFFNAVGAPAWHGRNFNALRDSIKTGGINAAAVPYRLVVKNFDKVGDGAKQIAADFIDLIHELAAEGCPVDIKVESQD